MAAFVVGDIVSSFVLLYCSVKYCNLLSSGGTSSRECEASLRNFIIFVRYFFVSSLIFRTEGVRTTGE